jgi:prophage maintenance system killer protein
MFLKLNGMVFTATEESVVVATLGLPGNDDIIEPKYVAWVKAHSKRA